MTATGESLDVNGKNEEALGNRSNLRSVQDYRVRTAQVRVVMNEQTGTAQPPDYGSDTR